MYKCTKVNYHHHRALSKAALTFCPSQSFFAESLISSVQRAESITLYLAFANDIKGVPRGPLSNDAVTFSVVRLWNIN